ncbi:MAG TPA: hypothetical protein VME92_22845 [Acetobacteraceae bacterium]|nr:hypothetical protein [Acetobacteraceae bacterium]
MSEQAAGSECGGPAIMDGSMAMPTPEFTVIVAERTRRLSRSVAPLLGSLGIELRSVCPGEPLRDALREVRPMAVLSRVDDQAEDGRGVMATVAAHDPSLPVLLVAGRDPDIQATIADTERRLGLSQLHRFAWQPGMGDFLEFLFRAGMRNGHGRLMPV